VLCVVGLSRFSRRELAQHRPSPRSAGRTTTDSVDKSTPGSPKLPSDFRSRDTLGVISERFVIAYFDDISIILDRNRSGPDAFEAEPFGGR
jgi:hypothetical protein